MQPTRAGEGIGSQPGNGVAEEAGEVQEALPVDRTPEEEFLAQMLAATGATNLQEAGLYDPVEVAAEEERIEEMSPEERQAKADMMPLAAAFDMIRERSNEGKLTTPGTWAAAGIVPDHLIPLISPTWHSMRSLPRRPRRPKLRKAAEEAVQRLLKRLTQRVPIPVPKTQRRASEADGAAGEHVRLLPSPIPRF